MRIRSRLAGVMALALTGVLTACGGAGEGSGKTVTMWAFPVLPEGEGDAFWEKTTKAFEAENSGIDVKVNVYPWEGRDEKLATAIAAGKQPDAVYLIPDQLPKYAGAIVPATEYLSEKEIADYRDNVVEGVSYDGKMMGAPILMSVLPTVCNKKVFEKSGVDEYPKTWDDLLAMAPKFKKNGYYATEIPADTTMTLNNSWYIHLWQAGGAVYGQDGTKVAFNSPEGLAALQFEKKLADGGYVPKQSLTKIPQEGQGATAKGKVACLYANGTPKLLEKYWGKGNVVVMPPLTDGTHPMKTYGTIGSFTMLETDNQDSTAKWISYVTGKQVMTKYLKASGYYPPKESVGTLYADDPILGKAEKYLDVTTAGPLEPQARDIMGVIAPELQAALLGKKPPEQALGDAERAANGLIR